MLQKILFITVLALLPFQFCKRIPNLPEPMPGKRNYVWEVDTLDTPMNQISSVWGSAPNNVWAVGEGGTYKDRLQHYDGTKWTAYSKELINIGGSTLYGFDADNIWMGGQAGWGFHGAGIWHYNGAKWSRNYNYNIEGSYSIRVNDIWGNRLYDIYACGIVVFHDSVKEDELRGFVLHYDGKQWREIARAQVNSQFHVVRKERKNVYLLSTVVKNSSFVGFEIYKLKDAKLEKIFSVQRTQIHAVNMCTILGKVYFVMDHDILRYVDGKFTKYLTIDHETFASVIHGRNEFDIFLRMRDGIAHYNGEDIEYLYHFPRGSINLYNAFLFEKEVFFYGLSNDFKDIMLHGKLKE